MTTRTQPTLAFPTSLEDRPPGTEQPLPASSTRHDVARSTGGRDQQLVSIRARVPEEDAPGFISEALHDIRAYLQEHHTPTAGPPFSVCRPVEGGLVDVEAGWPVAEPVAGTSRIHCGALPAPFVRTSSESGVS